MKNKKLSWALLAISIVFVGCEPDEGPPPPEPESREVLILNAGFELEDFATLSTFIVDDADAEHNLYQKANKNFMGQNGIDAIRDENGMFILLNGSSKLIQIDPETYELIDQITGLENPRHIQRVRNRIAYISSWNRDGVYKVNTNSGKILDFIKTGLGPGDMTVDEDFVFIPNTGGAFNDSTVIMRSASTDTLIDTLFVGHRPNSIVVDEERNMFVLCGGFPDDQNPFNSTFGSLWHYHLDSIQMALDSNLTLEAEDTLIFPDNNLRPNRLRLSADGEFLLYMSQEDDSDIFRMRKTANKFPDQPFLSGDYDYFDIDTKFSEIYVVDDGAEGNKLNSRVLRFDSEGGLISDFQSDTRPRSFIFDQQQ